MGRSIYNYLPSDLKHVVRSVLGLIPASWRLRRRTRAMQAFLRASESWSHERWRAFQDRKVRELVAYAYERVPYYREVWKQHGVRPADIDGAKSLALLPTIDSRVLNEQYGALQARGVPRRYKIAMTTGGTMGRPTRLLLHRRITQDSEAAHINHMWDRVGYRPGARRLILRGALVRDSARGRTHYYDPSLNAVWFSSFHLTDDELAKLVALIREFRPEFVHTYPSIATIVCQYLQRQNVRDLPPIKAVLASSENYYPGQRELISRTLGARFFSWYGHAEHLILAGECEYTTDYHAFPSYGVLELMSEDLQLIAEDGVPGHLVGTGFHNPVMPLIRYRTGDWAERAGSGCPQCGRNFPLLRNVRGHYYQELFVGPQGQLIPMTAVNVHDGTFCHVRQYQFHQTEPGRITLRLAVAPEYGERDEALIRNMVRERLGSMELRLDYVESIAATARGKWKYLVQELDTGRSWIDDSSCRPEHAPAGVQECQP